MHLHMAIANKVRPAPQAQFSAKAVKVRLIELDLTVTELAKRLGLARNTVSLAINQATMLSRVKARIRRELRMPS
jgi:hypothetical protein